MVVEGMLDVSVVVVVVWSLVIGRRAQTMMGSSHDDWLRDDLALIWPGGSGCIVSIEH